MIILNETNKGILRTLWQLATGMLENIQKLWDWLNDSVDLNFTVFGFTVGLPSFKPIEIIAVGLTTWIVWILIKNLVPGL